MTRREKIIYVVLALAFIGGLYFTQAPECRKFGSSTPAYCID